MPVRVRVSVWAIAARVPASRSRGGLPVIAPMKSLRERLAGTLAAIAHTLTLTRAGIYRVHDIQEVRNFLDVWDVLQGHREIAADALLDRSLWRSN